MLRGVGVAVTAALLVLSGVAGPIAGAPVTDPAESASALRGAAIEPVDRDTVEVTRVLSREDPDTVRVTAEYRIGRDIERVESRLPEESTVVETDGFRVIDDEVPTVVWTGGTDEASVEFLMPAERQNDRMQGTDFAATDDWALVRLPPMATTAQSRGEERPQLVRSNEIDGPGVVGTRIAYLGPYDAYTAHGERESIRLVVPSAAEMAESPGDVLRALSRTSELFDVGAPGSVTVFVAPDPIREGGLAYRHDAWVSDDQELATSDSMWLHEYVHTRQSYRTTEETKWLIEAEAVYYATLFAWKLGLIEFDDVRERLEAGREHPDVVLADESTWAGTTADYERGALTVAALDAELRRTSDGEATYQDVLRGTNARSGPVDHATYRSEVQKASSQRFDADRFLTAHVEGDQQPAVPNDPYLYSVDSDADLRVDAANDGAPPGGTVSLAITIENGGPDTSITPGFELDAPDGWEVVAVEDATRVPDRGWRTTHLESGESRTVVVDVAVPEDAAVGDHDLTVEAYDVGGNGATARETVAVGTPPTVSIDAPRTVAAGQPTSMEASVEAATDAYTVTWQLPGGSTVTGTTVEYAFDTGQWVVTVVVEDERGIVSRTKAVITAHRPIVEPWLAIVVLVTLAAIGGYLRRRRRAATDATDR